MVVKAKLSRVSYDYRTKPIVQFSMDQCYHAFEGLDGTFTVSDNRGNPTHFTKDEFYQFFKIIEVPESNQMFKLKIKEVIERLIKQNEENGQYIHTSYDEGYMSGVHDGYLDILKAFEIETNEEYYNG